MREDYKVWISFPGGVRYFSFEFLIFQHIGKISLYQIENIFEVGAINQIICVWRIKYK
jgi:hypothetical protein